MITRIIKTEQDYAEAITRLSALMDTSPEKGSESEAELELLALIIEDYERKIVPEIHVSPIDAILFRMEQMGLRKSDLVPYIGSNSKVSEVLSGKRPLSLNMIRRLNKGLGISAEVLIGNLETSTNILENAKENYACYPLVELNERGYFSNSKIQVKNSQLVDYAEELIKDFFSGLIISDHSPAFLRALQYQSGAKEINDYAVIAWLACILKKARSMPLLGTYKIGAITEQWLHDLIKLSRFEQGPLLAKEFLSQHGIALVVEQHFKKTYLDGAALMDNGMPIIGLTLRYDRLDNFWFVLLHELIHIQRHLTSEITYITDNLDDSIQVDETVEKEANQGAINALIPLEKWLESEVKSNPTHANVKQLANDLGVHEAIIAGRVRYETKNWKLLSGMVGRGQVSKLFENQKQLT
jgi:HTH-type transcriptional regulator / antitoxin HigA